MIQRLRAFGFRVLGSNAWALGLGLPGFRSAWGLVGWGQEMAQSILAQNEYALNCGLDDNMAKTGWTKGWGLP